jgi:ParB/RepB/Spo0J family partition protein
MSRENRLPSGYDELVPKERLHHDQHNVRRVPASDQLKRSIEKDGIQSPLIVRQVERKHGYGIVDGWQRYQAATSLGWDELPAEVYDDSLAALEAAEAQSIVSEWTTYQAAIHVQSLYGELTEQGATVGDAPAVLQHVAERTARSPSTVRRYLRALSIPGYLHPLLKERANVTEEEWLALENYEPGIRQYDGVAWEVAAEVGKHQTSLSEERQRRLLIAAVGYDKEDGVALVREGVEDRDAPIDLLQYRLEGTGQYQGWLRVPQTGVSLDEAQKQALLDYCRRRKVHLSDIVADQVRQMAEGLSEDWEFEGEGNL